MKKTTESIDNKIKETKLLIKLLATKENKDHRNELEKNISSNIIDLINSGIDIQFVDYNKIYTVGEEDSRFSMEFPSYKKAKEYFIEMTSNYQRMNLPDINTKKMQIYRNFELIYEIEVGKFTRMKAMSELHEIEEKLNISKLLEE